MSANKHQPHVVVLPEDDANRKIANGFRLHRLLLTRRMDVAQEAGGWLETLSRFNEQYAQTMDWYPTRYMVILIDFDDDEGRGNWAKAQIPAHLTNRVFVLGVLSQPEALRRAGLGSYEQIGLAMAKDCHDQTAEIWGHELLRHNTEELDRLRERVRPFLFRQATIYEQ